MGRRSKLLKNAQDRLAENYLLRLLLIYFSFYALASYLSFFVNSYFEIRPLSTLSFLIQDGWCNSAIQGIGEHCFGDFYYTLKFVNESNPWSAGPNPYPPFALLLFKPFSFLVSKYPESNVGLILYLIVMLISFLIVPVYLVLRKKISKSIGFALSILLLTATPTVIVLDRGNSIFLCVPLLFFFLKELSSKNETRAVLCLLLMVLIKPHLILLGILFIRKGNIVQGLSKNIFLLIGFLFSFTFYGSLALSNIVDYSKQILGYQEYADLGQIFPVNISISNTAQLVANQVFGINLNSTTLKFILLSSCLSVIWYVYNHFKTDNLQCLISVVLLPMIVPNVSFHYYLILIVTLLVFVMYKTLISVESSSESSCGYNFHSRSSLNIKIFIFIILSFVPWQIPMRFFTNSTDSEISFHWILVSIYLVFLMIPTNLLHKFSARKS